MSTYGKMVSRFLILLLPIIAACNDPGAIAFQRGDEVHWAGLDDVPPGSVTSSKLVSSLGGWGLGVMSLSPNGGLLAIAVRNNHNPSAGLLDARVRVFNVLQTPVQLVAEWDEDDLKDIIESNANLTYPSELEDFNPFALGWMNNEHLLINVQPIIAGTSIESLPQNVALVISYRDGSLADPPALYARTDPSPITEPDHPQKNAFATENRSGAIFVEGDQVNGLATDIDEFDFVYLGG